MNVNKSTTLLFIFDIYTSNKNLMIYLFLNIHTFLKHFVTKYFDKNISADSEDSDIFWARCATLLRILRVPFFELRFGAYFGEPLFALFCVH